MAAASRCGKCALGARSLDPRFYRMLRRWRLVRVLRGGASLARHLVLRVVDTDVPVVHHAGSHARQPVLLRRAPVPGSALAGVVLGRGRGLSGHGCGRHAGPPHRSRGARLAQRRSHGLPVDRTDPVLPARDPHPARADWIGRADRAGTAGLRPRRTGAERGDGPGRGVLVPARPPVAAARVVDQSGAQARSGLRRARDAWRAGRARGRDLSAAEPPASGTGAHTPESAAPAPRRPASQRNRPARRRDRPRLQQHADGHRGIQRHGARRPCAW